ncbi:hypothetical protein J6590_093917 [Homalodisca vitripennis]|nr:hypothetical protein J6590_093917 [Homalodisca vitripennis]
MCYALVCTENTFRDQCDFQTTLKFLGHCGMFNQIWQFVDKLSSCLRRQTFMYYRPVSPSSVVVTTSVLIKVTIKKLPILSDAGSDWERNLCRGSSRCAGTAAHYQETVKSLRRWERLGNETLCRGSSRCAGTAAVLSRNCQVSQTLGATRERNALSGKFSVCKNSCSTIKKLSILSDAGSDSGTKRFVGEVLGVQEQLQYYQETVKSLRRWERLGNETLCRGSSRCAVTAAILSRNCQVSETLGATRERNALSGKFSTKCMARETAARPAALYVISVFERLGSRRRPPCLGRQTCSAANCAARPTERVISREQLPHCANSICHSGYISLSNVSPWTRQPATVLIVHPSLPAIPPPPPRTARAGRRVSASATSTVDTRYESQQVGGSNERNPIFHNAKDSYDDFPDILKLKTSDDLLWSCKFRNSRGAPLYPESLQCRATAAGARHVLSKYTGRMDRQEAGTGGGGANPALSITGDTTQTCYHGSSGCPLITIVSAAISILPRLCHCRAL